MSKSIENVHVDLGQVSTVPDKTMLTNTTTWIVVGAMVSVTLCSAAAIAVMFTVGKNAFVTTLSTTTSTTSTTSTTRTTSTTSTTSTTRTTSTTSISCPAGFVATSSSVCVDLLTDFNNCGSVGYICSSSYSICLNGTCSTGVPSILQGGVSVSGWGGSSNVDDLMVTVTMPFAISLYNSFTTSVTIQSNGCICLGGCSTSFSNGNLPSSSFSGPTAFGYWDDLYIRSGTTQTVYYGTTGTSPNRSAVFEYYTSRSSGSTQFVHFQMIFYEGAPNIVQYLYYQAVDRGVSATIGVQASTSGPSMTYSVDTVSVPYGSAATTTPTLTLTFNTITGTSSSSG